MKPAPEDIYFVEDLLKDTLNEIVFLLAPT
jgi:hypothetical protein